MKQTSILFTFFLVGLLSCNKDTYTTRPQLSFKSVNGNTFGANQAIIFTLEFTDKEGDIQDSIFVQKVTRTNGCNSFNDRVKIPPFTATANLKGNFEIGYATGNIPNSIYTVIPKCTRNDTCFFRFWATDKAKNRSDTVVSSDIVILR